MHTRSVSSDASLDPQVRYSGGLPYLTHRIVEAPEKAESETKRRRDPTLRFLVSRCSLLVQDPADEDQQEPENEQS